MSGNMSYCRFQNTLIDLRDCEESLGDGLEVLSDEEREAAESLILTAKRIADGYGHLVELGRPKPKKAEADSDAGLQLLAKRFPIGPAKR